MTYISSTSHNNSLLQSLLDRKVFTEDFIPFYEHAQKSRAKRISYMQKINDARQKIIEKQASRQDVVTYYNFGFKMRNAYSSKGTRLKIERSDAYLRSLKISPNVLKDNILSHFKYKRNEKWDQIKALIKTSYLLAKDTEGKYSKRNLDRRTFYCCFTNFTLDFLKERYNFDLGLRSLTRLVDVLAEEGLVVPNTYIDRQTFEVRKNYRFDSVNKKASYATAYLLNLKAIKGLLGKEDFEELYDKKNASNSRSFVRRMQDRNFDLVHYSNFKPSKKIESFFSNDKDIFAKISAKKSLDNAVNCCLSLLLSDSNVKEAKKSDAFTDIKNILKECDIEDDASVKSASVKLLKVAFSQKTNKASDLAFKLIDEYNNSVPVDEFHKRMNLHIKKNKYSCRIWSNICSSSDEDGTREKIVEDNNLCFRQDVSSMIPNLLRFLSTDNDFKQEDIYTMMSDRVFSETGQKISRDAMKIMFLRAHFSKSLGKFLTAMRMSYAAEAAKDENCEAFPYVFINDDSFLLSSKWSNSNDGKQKIAFWTGIYKAVHELCGNDSSSLVFFWESLLELIICVKNTRKGLYCGNVYDEFFCNKVFDLNADLQFASQIVKKAYYGDNAALEDFVNGK